MKRLPYLWLTAFILLANGWLYHAMSSFISNSTPDFGKSALTWLAAIPQLPSLMVSKIIGDSFDLPDAAWALVTSMVSILIYFPLLYLIRHLSGRAARVLRVIRSEHSCDARLL